MKEDEVMVFDSVGGVDEDTYGLNKNSTTRLLNAENVYLPCDNDLVDDDELHLVTIVIQTHKWKPNNKNSICWGLFTINDNSPIDIKNPHMSHCITYKLIPQKVGNITLNHNFVLHNGLIRYNKMNDIFPLKMHIDATHVHLLAKKKVKTN